MSDKDDKKIIKASTPNSKNYDAKIDIYSKDPKITDKKDTIHFAINTETGKGKIITKNEGEKRQETDTQCYLTTACMKHYMDEFDDNCYYLDILRWFRDNYVSLEDKKEYYNIAPKVVETINELENVNDVYNEIYYTVIQLCVRLIEYGRYDEAYQIYKANVLDLQNKYVKKLALNK